MCDLIHLMEATECARKFIAWNGKIKCEQTFSINELAFSFGTMFYFSKLCRVTEVYYVVCMIIFIVLVYNFRHAIVLAYTIIVKAN